MIFTIKKCYSAIEYDILEGMNFRKMQKKTFDFLKMLYWYTLNKILETI